MRTLTCIAVDDEAMALEVIKSHLGKIPFMKAEAFFTDALAALAFLQENSVDVVFLDIQMPDLHGTQMARLIDGHMRVIFTTAYSDYAVEGFELRALDYLVKPIAFNRFFSACQHALSQTGHRHGELPYTFIKDGFEWIRIEIADILFLKAEGNYVEFHFSRRKVLSRMTLKEALELLPSSDFLQVHRSYIVAADKIERIIRDEIRIGSHTIPVGTNFLPAISKLIDGAKR